MKISKEQLRHLIKEEMETLQEMRVRASKGNVYILLNTCGQLINDAASYFIRNGGEEEKELARIYRECQMDIRDMKQALIDSMKV